MFRWLFADAFGAEACEELEREYTNIRDRHAGVVAWLWYVAHLFRPSTWALARELRRARRTGRGDVGSPSQAIGAGFGISWLDVKLGLRMLVKYPGLTLVSGLAMSVTIAIAIGTFSFFQDFFLRPTVPLPEGDRIVSLGLRTTDTNRTQRRLLHDFVVWRSELETIEDVSIWRTVARNIVTPDGRGELVPLAMMSASGFKVARVPPLLGRPLLDSDEIDGAQPVIVIGYDEWMTRFEGDPGIVGRTIQIGRNVHTIVGVMPKGFTFPVSHKLWVPFSDDPDDYPVMEGPDGYFAFGRLAPGVTEAAARAEVTSIANRRAVQFPETHEHMRGQVMTYTDTHTGMDDVTAGGMIFVRVFLGMITLVVLIPFANVATLVYARTATRAGEIAVRSALGASRRRIVAQLFVEALVLSTLSAAAGIGLALFVLARLRFYMDTYMSAGMPFWAKNGQDPWVVAYAAGLTILAAVVAGIVPGLQATGRGGQANLNARASGSGMRLGSMWTALIVTQVAITVAFLPLVGSVGWQAIGLGFSRPTFAAHEFLGARISAEGAPTLMTFSGGSATDSHPELIEEVVRRLEADPLVTGVTLASSLPGDLFSTNRRLEVEGVDPPLDSESHRVSVSAVAEDFFDVLGVRIEGGRALNRADWEVETRPVMVNRTFVQQVLGGANPIGRRIRDYRGPDDEPAPWREIVGFVDDLSTNPINPENVISRIFTPLDRSWLANAVHLIVRVPSSPGDFAPELRRITTSVDPTLRLFLIMPLGDLDDPLRTITRAAAAGLGLVILSVLLLSTAGIFSLMSFNVTQRRREIGIRSALGANPRRVVAGVMARSVKQLGTGVLVGLLVLAVLPPINLDGFVVERDMRLIIGVAVLMVTVGLLAAAGPVRRGLQIQPAESLREQ
ncbi:MAG: ABC transporter permease [Gemmatimonadetes bacterium]|nr:ABC transporter permease [Gemmatimonadota bacterium]